MTRIRTRARAATLGLLIPLALARPGVARDDAPPAPKPSPAAEAARAIVPTPPQAIPDDPPPHEGALIDVPYIIEPSDILVVEVLEGLPGRPITGERLVRPDGTISLGFYGDVHVRGLTVTQAKVKVIHHLREFLIDRALGLARYMGDPVAPLPPPGTEGPSNLMPAPDEQPPAKPEVAPPENADVKPLPRGGRSPFNNELAAPPPAAPPETTKAAAKATGRQSRRAERRAKRAKAAATKRSEPLVTYAGMQDPAAQPAESGSKPTAAADGPSENPGEAPAVEHDSSYRLIYIDPKDSDRVMVDIASYNTKVYYVQGDVASPGRLPITGKETVLDALNYGGGLITSSEPNDIHLYRPARGGKPAKDYRIDLAAIRRGDVRANLQMFDGDRLIVGRNATVQKAVEADRAAAPINSILNASLMYSFASRSLATAIGEGTAATAAQRDAALRRWFDLFKDLPADKAGVLDPARVLDAAPTTGTPPVDGPKPETVAPPR